MSEQAVPYYLDQDKGCDDLVRCFHCKRLVTAQDLATSGSCLCGSRKVTEIRYLGFWEWLRIRLGIIDFPSRELFLKEFGVPWRK